jgi:hypothetical protein
MLTPAINAPIATEKLAFIASSDTREHHEIVEMRRTSGSFATNLKGDGSPYLVIRIEIKTSAIPLAKEKQIGKTEGFVILDCNARTNILITSSKRRIPRVILPAMVSSSLLSESNLTVIRVLVKQHVTATYPAVKPV